MKIAFPNYIKSQSEQIEYLVKNKVDLIDLKKSAIKFTDEVGGEVHKKLVVLKAADTSTDTDSEITRTIVGNTYNWMDSHDDVHLNGLFGVSIQQKGDRVRHFHDHINQLSARVGVPKRVYEEQIKWSDLGVNRMGETMSLMMDSRIKRAMNAMIFEDYKDGNIDQHSVGMRYIKIDLAVNNPENKEEYAVWNKVFPMIGNPERALEKGYFWAVKEAALIEISCVLEGSNELTPTMNPELSSSEKTDPASASQERIKTLLDYLN